jgi:hypothetical protein
MPNYTLYICVFAIVTQWSLIFNNYQYNFYFFSAKPFVIYFVPNISWLHVGTVVSTVQASIG